MSSLSKEVVRSRYDSNARFYDFALRLYALVGIRKEYRRRVVKLLRLRPGSRVVELGCGTGVNFPLIMDQIGAQGRLIGVDLSPRMLALARRRVEKAGWNGVELVHGDIASFRFPEAVDGVLATGVFGYLDDPDPVIQAAARALSPGGRLAILDGKRPNRMPSWLFRLFVWVSRPFGVTADYFDGRTWESVERHFRKTTMEHMYGGMLFLASGTAPPADRSTARHGS